jgi:hypothetical protein
MSDVNRVNFSDASIASLSGSSQTLLSGDTSRSYVLIQNTGNANIGLNLTGGTAAILGLGTMTLATGAIWIADTVVPINTIKVIGTAGQPVLCVVG